MSIRERRIVKEVGVMTAMLGVMAAGFVAMGDMWLAAWVFLAFLFGVAVVARDVRAEYLHDRDMDPVNGDAQ